MPLRPTTRVITQQTAGLITDSSEVAPVANSFTDQDNIRIDTQGSIQRRRGISQMEVSSSSTPPGTDSDTSRALYLWSGVNLDTNTDVYCTSTGGLIDFYDIEDNGTLTKLTPVIDLELFIPHARNSYKSSAGNPHPLNWEDEVAPFGFDDGGGVETTSVQEGISNTLHTEPPFFVSGNGSLFIFHPSCDPIEVTLSDDLSEIKAVVVSRQTRDFDGADEGANQNKRVAEGQETFDRKYNLANQGWQQTEVSNFVASEEHYPSLSDSPNVGRVEKPDGGYEFKVDHYRTLSYFSGESERGHYVRTVECPLRGYQSGKPYDILALPGVSATVQLTAPSDGIPAGQNRVVVTITDVEGVLSLRHNDFVSVQSAIVTSPANRLASLGTVSDAYVLTLVHVQDPAEVTAAQQAVKDAQQAVRANYQGRGDYHTSHEPLVADLENAEEELRRLLKDSPVTPPNSEFKMVWGVDPTHPLPLDTVMPVENLFINAGESKWSSQDLVTIRRERPKCGAFYAGRLWQSESYGSDIYYSQVIDDVGKSADLKHSQCYQEGDPTNPDDNKVVDTDGGTVSMPSSGVTYWMGEVEDNLVLIKGSGVWALSPPQGDFFKPTNYNRQRVSSSQPINSQSVVAAADTIFYLTSEGVATLVKEQYTLKLREAIVSENKIDTYLREIPKEFLRNAHGAYDPINRVIQWVVPGATKALILNYDVGLNAFYKWTVSRDSGFIAGTPHEWRIMSVADLPRRVHSAYRFTYLAGTRDESQLAKEGLYDGYSLTVSNNQYRLRDWVRGKADSLYSTNLGYEGEEEPSTIPDSTIAPGAGAPGFNHGGTTYTSHGSMSYDLGDSPNNIKFGGELDTYLKRTERGFSQDDNGTYAINPGSIEFRISWDWSDSLVAGEYEQYEEAYKQWRELVPDSPILSYDDGQKVVQRGLSMRGSGNALQVHFKSNDDKDFEVLGIGYEIQTVI